jgi:hypothetical protein
MCSVEIRYQKGRKIRGVKTARESPKLKHQTPVNKTNNNISRRKNIKRLIAVRNKNEMTRNQMKNERNQMYKK